MNRKFLVGRLEVKAKLRDVFQTSAGINSLRAVVEALDISLAETLISSSSRMTEDGRAPTARLGSTSACLVVQAGSGVTTNEGLAAVGDAQKKRSASESARP